MTQTTNKENLKTITPKEIELFKQMRSISGITAEYLMIFLDRFSSKTEQLLIYSICCNFDRLKHTIELQLLERGIYLSGAPYDPSAFTNITYVDVNLADEIQKFLLEKEQVSVINRLFVD